MSGFSEQWKKLGERKKRLVFRACLVIPLILAAVIYILPTFNPKFWPYKKINLGLDLQGGMHLVLEVQTEKAVENKIETLSQDLRIFLRKEKIPHLGIERNGAHIAIRLKEDADFDKIKQLVVKEFGDLSVELAQESGQPSMKIAMSPAEEESTKTQAVEQALETIRNRIDAFGVSEPDIRTQGKQRILIQLPGVEDPQRAKALIQNTAQLEFKIVDDSPGGLKAALDGNVPRDSEILYEENDDPQTDKKQRIPYLVKKRAALTGDYLKDARVHFDQQNFNEPYIAISFDSKGGRIFAQVTGENIKKQLAIVLDGKIHSAPVIQDKITGGEARITGRFTMDEANDLAIVLRAGAMPAPVKILEERTVGPSLGKDSITAGKLSLLVSTLAIMVFMIFYYKGAGLISIVGLIVNILLLAGCLAALQATLTLPGIAGIVLTIGMAVDANVLIYERIREELRRDKDKRPGPAIENGFSRAALSILDSNITTLIVGLVLYQFGTGPVKGFAVTLSLGILTSIFTALIVCRLIFDYFLEVHKIKTVSI